MRISVFLRLIVVLIFAVSPGACVTGGEVVRVTDVQASPSAILKAEELEKLEEIKRATGAEKPDHKLSMVIEGTPHFTVTEYLETHPEARETATQNYRVGGYDVLSLTVYEENDLSRGAVRISADGYITFPLIGRLKVANLTTGEIEKLISRRLAEEDYLLDAHVSVMVTQFMSKRFLVLGTVGSPGSYPLQGQERVLEAISKAAGVHSEKAGKKAMIIRTENPGEAQKKRIVITIDLQSLLKGEDQISNLRLANEDVIYIPPAEYFYIIGEVRSPGSFVVPDGEITLVEAIGMAGGFTRIAARNRTRIIRVENGVEKVIEVKVDAITRAGKKIQDVVIQPNDVIVVPESFF